MMPFPSRNVGQIPPQVDIAKGDLWSARERLGRIELSRFVLDDAYPSNSESWFSRCLDELLTVAVRGVVLFADPVPRRAADGRLIALATWDPSTRPPTRRAAGGHAADADGAAGRSVLNDRAAQKVRRQEQDHECVCVCVEQRLTALGAHVRRRAGIRRLRQALEEVGARRLRHAGAHRYVFRLGRNRREREQVVLSLPTIPLYPNKSLDAA
jgi:hypothetical protein